MLVDSFIEEKFHVNWRAAGEAVVDE